MSIAAGASATSLKAVAGAESHGHKARSSAPSPTDALGGGGFLALLMSMDPETALGTDSEGATEQFASLAPQAVMPEPTPASLLLPSPSPRDAMTQNIQQDLSLLLAQAGAGGMGSTVAKDQVAGLDLPPASGADPAPGGIRQLSSVPLTVTRNQLQISPQNLQQNLDMPLVQTATGDVGEASQMAGFVHQIGIAESSSASIASKSSSPLAFAQSLTAPLAKTATEEVGEASQMAGFVHQIGMVESSLASLLSTASPPLALAQSLQQRPARPLVQVAAGGAGAVDPLAGLAPQTGMQDPSPAPSGIPITQPSPPPQAMAQRLQHALATGADKPERLIERAVFSMSESTAGRVEKVDPLLGQAEPLVPLRPSRGKGAELQARAGSSLLESRLSSSMEASPRESAILGALMNSGRGEGILRQVDRSTAGPSALSGAYGADGVWGQQGPLAGTGTDLSTGIPDPSMTSLESMVADTVSYWVAQGVQNAELKLDGLGPDPVDVSISLKGDEAHIDFRTDQPEIRQVLEGAAAHLKDLLAKEGLVLSGVSVGASSQQGPGAQEQRHRQGARQAAVARVEVAPTEPRPRAIQSLAGTVDIFV